MIARQGIIDVKEKKWLANVRYLRLSSYHFVAISILYIYTCVYNFKRYCRYGFLILFICNYNKNKLFQVLNNRIFCISQTSFYYDKQHGFIRSVENVTLTKIYTKHKTYWHKEGNERCLLNKESISGHRCERTAMVAKCKIFMHCSENIIGICKKQI